jgi:hypothetical protein
MLSMTEGWCSSSFNRSQTSLHASFCICSTLMI